jgi:membrane protease YdiL (CAAX protease family)
MLFLPLFDRGWRIPVISRSRSHHLTWVVLAIVGIAILAWRPAEIPFALSTLLTAALPEEWFFRAYFMARLGSGWRANLIASLLFSVLHGLSHDWHTALMVFPASLFFGWLYQRTRDLPLLILVHALSNLLFVVFVARLTMIFTRDLL